MSKSQHQSQQQAAHQTMIHTHQAHFSQSRTQAHGQLQSERSAVRKAEHFQASQSQKNSLKSTPGLLKTNRVQANLVHSSGGGEQCQMDRKEARRMDKQQSRSGGHHAANQYEQYNQHQNVQSAKHQLTESANTFSASQSGQQIHQMSKAPNMGQRYGPSKGHQGPALDELESVQQPPSTTALKQVAATSSKRHRKEKRHGAHGERTNDGTTRQQVHPSKTMKDGAPEINEHKEATSSMPTQLASQKQQEQNAIQSTMTHNLDNFEMQKQKAGAAEDLVAATQLPSMMLNQQVAGGSGEVEHTQQYLESMIQHYQQMLQKVQSQQHASTQRSMDEKAVPEQLIFNAGNAFSSQNQQAHPAPPLPARPKEQTFKKSTAAATTQGQPHSSKPLHKAHAPLQNAATQQNSKGSSPKAVGGQQSVGLSMGHGSERGRRRQTMGNSESPMDKNESSSDLLVEQKKFQGQHVANRELPGDDDSPQQHVSPPLQRRNAQASSKQIPQDKYLSQRNQTHADKHQLAASENPDQSQEFRSRLNNHVARSMGASNDTDPATNQLDRRYHTVHEDDRSGNRKVSRQKGANDGHRKSNKMVPSGDAQVDDLIDSGRKPIKQTVGAESNGVDSAIQNKLLEDMLPEQAPQQLYTRRKSFREPPSSIAGQPNQSLKHFANVNGGDVAEACINQVNQMEDDEQNLKNYRMDHSNEFAAAQAEAMKQGHEAGYAASQQAAECNQKQEAASRVANEVAAARHQSDIQELDDRDSGLGQPEEKERIEDDNEEFEFDNNSHDTNQKQNEEHQGDGGDLHIDPQPSNIAPQNLFQTMSNKKMNQQSIGQEVAPQDHFANGHEEGRSNEGYMGDDGYDPEEDCDDEILLADDEGLTGSPHSVTERHRRPQQNASSFSKLTATHFQYDSVRSAHACELLPDQEENDDAASVLHSQYFQDKNDCTGMSQIHYDDQAEECFDDEIDCRHQRRDDESDYSNEQTQDLIRDDNCSQGSQVLDDANRELLEYDEGGNPNAIYDDDMAYDDHNQHHCRVPIQMLPQNKRNMKNAINSQHRSQLQYFGQHHHEARNLNQEQYDLDQSNYESYPTNLQNGECSHQANYQHMVDERIGKDGTMNANDGDLYDEINDQTEEQLQQEQQQEFAKDNEDPAHYGNQRSDGSNDDRFQRKGKQARDSMAIVSRSCRQALASQTSNRQMDESRYAHKWSRSPGSNGEPKSTDQSNQSQGIFKRSDRGGLNPKIQKRHDLRHNLCEAQDIVNCEYRTQGDRGNHRNESEPIDNQLHSIVDQQSSKMKLLNQTMASYHMSPQIADSLTFRHQNGNLLPDELEEEHDSDMEQYQRASINQQAMDDAQYSEMDNDHNDDHLDMTEFQIGEIPADLSSFTIQRIHDHKLVDRIDLEEYGDDELHDDNHYYQMNGQYDHQNPEAKDAEGRQLLFLCLIECQLPDFEEPRPYQQMYTWLSIRRILNSSEISNPFHLRMYCEGKNFSFNGMEKIRMIEEEGTEHLNYDDEHSNQMAISRSNSENLTRDDGLSNSRYAAEEYGEESNSKWALHSSSARFQTSHMIHGNYHYAADQESLKTSSIDVNNVTQMTYMVQPGSAMTVNTSQRNNLSGTTSAVASAAAPSTIRDMTLPPLSDHQSDNYNRGYGQHLNKVSHQSSDQGELGPCQFSSSRYEVDSNIFNYLQPTQNHSSSTPCPPASTTAGPGSSKNNQSGTPCPNTIAAGVPRLILESNQAPPSQASLNNQSSLAYQQSHANQVKGATQSDFQKLMHASRDSATIPSNMPTPSTSNLPHHNDRENQPDLGPQSQERELGARKGTGLHYGIHNMVDERISPTQNQGNPVFSSSTMAAGTTSQMLARQQQNMNSNQASSELHDKDMGQVIDGDEDDVGAEVRDENILEYDTVYKRRNGKQGDLDAKRAAGNARGQHDDLKNGNARQLQQCSTQRKQAISSGANLNLGNRLDLDDKDEPVNEEQLADDHDDTPTQDKQNLPQQDYDQDDDEYISNEPQLRRPRHEMTKFSVRSSQEEDESPRNQDQSSQSKDAIGTGHNLAMSAFPSSGATNRKRGHEAPPGANEEQLVDNGKQSSGPGTGRTNSEPGADQLEVRCPPQATFQVVCSAPGVEQSPECEPSNQAIISQLAHGGVERQRADKADKIWSRSDLPDPMRQYRITGSPDEQPLKKSEQNTQDVGWRGDAARRDDRRVEGMEKEPARGLAQADRNARLQGAVSCLEDEDEVEGLGQADKSLNNTPRSDTMKEEATQGNCEAKRDHSPLYSKNRSSQREPRTEQGLAAAAANPNDYQGSKDKNVKKTRFGRQSKKPVNFDQYSASQNQNSLKGDNEDDNEEYFCAFRKSQSRQQRRVNYRQGQHHTYEQQNSERGTYNQQHRSSVVEPLKRRTRDGGSGMPQKYGGASSRLAPASSLPKGSRGKYDRVNREAQCKTPQRVSPLRGSQMDGRGRGSKDGLGLSDPLVWSELPRIGQHASNKLTQSKRTAELWDCKLNEHSKFHHIDKPSIEAGDQLRGDSPHRRQHHHLDDNGHDDHSSDSNQINVSNYESSGNLTNDRQLRPRCDKKDEILGFISSSHQTDSKKENGQHDGKNNDCSIGDLALTPRRSKMFQKEFEERNRGYYTATPEPDQVRTRQGRKRTRMDLIDNDEQQSMDQTHCEQEIYEDGRYVHGRKKNRTWMQRQRSPSKDNENRGEFRNRMNNKNTIAKRCKQNKKKTTLKYMQKKIEGSFEQRHQAMRIRSLRNTMNGDIKDIVASLRKDRSKAEYEDLTDKQVSSQKDEMGNGFAEDGNTSTAFTYPYNAIMCTIEWHDAYGNDNKRTKIEDSRISYEEVRQREPKLLCEFFERHLQFSNV